MAAVLNPLKDQSMNRRTYDGCKTGDDLRVSTGPGRYQLNAPPQYCNACFAPEPTVRQQMWGATLNNGYIKTDVESDLLNLNRPTTKMTCNQYDPTKNAMNKTQTASEPVKECSFPQTHTRLVDPPCTGRATGWNRWEWLCDNPQETVMIPFDNMVTTRLQQKDQFRPCIPTAVAQDALLPAPLASDPGSLYNEADAAAMRAMVAPLGQVFAKFPQGLDEHGGVTGFSSMDAGAFAIQA
jgi:hypothetical protein